MIDATIQSGAVFRLEAGVILKFKAGGSLIRTLSSYGKELIIKGTAENPVILDGELGTPGSWGGVYLGGGIAPKILQRLQEPEFLAAFFSKGRMEPLMRSMPVRVICPSGKMHTTSP